MYANTYLDLTTGQSKYQGVYLWLRGMTYYWEDRPERARMDFEDCLRKAERQACLGKPCSVECERGLKLLRVRPGEPGFRINQEFKSGHTEVSLRPQSFERTLDQSQEVGLRLTSVGGTTDLLPQISKSLGDYAKQVDVEADDGLVVYRFKFPHLQQQGKTAKETHAYLAAFDGYLQKLIGVDPTNRDHALVVYVVTSSMWDDDYQDIPQRLHHFEVTGSSYFEPLDNSAMVISNIADPDGTIRHEFVHARVSTDFPGIPKWLDEGLAAFHEAGKFEVKENGELRVIPYGNWRINLLVDGRKRLRTDLPDLKTLVNPDCQGWSTDYYLVAGAYARYFVWYLHHKGVLADVYEQMRSGTSGLETLAGASTKLGLVDAGTSVEESLAALEKDVIVFLKRRARRGGQVDKKFYAAFKKGTATCVPQESVEFELPEDSDPGPMIEEPAPEPEPEPAQPEETVPVAPPSSTGRCSVTVTGNPGSSLWLFVLLLFRRRQN